MVSQLILTVTRACNLRCTYCPTAKDGWPSLSEADAVKAVRMFAEEYGGGAIKLFGGEPLLRPHVVRAAMEEARRHPAIRWVYLSTNGLGLNEDWLRYLKEYPKGILTISLDGRPEDHRAERVAVNSAVPDAYDHVVSLKDRLLRTPRVVITQTIAPERAVNADANLAHLLELGFWRFNFLPGYYIPWTIEQVDDLEQAFQQMSERIQARWRQGTKTYVRNLFTWAPTPFFNTGFVVDADRTIHPSNVGLSGALDHLRSQTAVGSLDEPPSHVQLRERTEQVNQILESSLDPHVLDSTRTVDGKLSDFCRGLYPHWAAYKRRGSAA